MLASSIDNMDETVNVDIGDKIRAAHELAKLRYDVKEIL